MAEAAQINYESIYRQRLDEKRRVPIPHRWRSGKDDFHLMVWPQHTAGTCLRALTPSGMNEFRSKINTMADSPDKAALKRFFGSRTITVTVDNAGRIAIPEEMAASADIKTDAVFVGLLDKFEIWSPQRFSRAEEIDGAQMAEALKKME